MNTTLVLPGAIASVLKGLLSLQVETGAVLLARPNRTPRGDLRLLAVELHLVPDKAYLRRESQGLLITSDGFVPALGRAEVCGAIPIWFHTHPGDGSSPMPSQHDRRVDSQLADLFRLRAASDFYGALVIASTVSRLSFCGHLDDGKGQSIPIDRLYSVGARMELVWNLEAARRSLDALFDRNVRAFGGDVQQAIRDLRIAIVGCGGTGSAVAEQLVRLGVADLLLVDPDTLSESNLTRVYGSFPTELGCPKADVLARHLRKIAPSATIKAVASSVNVELVAKALTDSDVIFGCTDDNAGRMVLSRLSSYFLVPTIDCGVLLSSDPSGRLAGIHGRVTVMHPGAACLMCRDRVDLARARAEMLTPEERIRRADEGYAPALPGIEPAVVAFTTAVAAAAVCELLERLTGYGPEPVPSEVLLRIHDREVSTNVAEPRKRHYCHPESEKLGLGFTDPFLDQVWSQ
jgi:ThiF family protein